VKHLAQLNIARLRHDLEDPKVAGFVDNLDRVNAVAERSDGFVWRLKDESGNATGIQAFKDPRMIVNLTVWESPEQLEKFVWQTVHKKVYQRKHEWMEVLDGMYFAMWWVEPGHAPGVAEAFERLDYLNEHGPSDYAFGWESLPQVQMWKEARCA
jgi:heme-degrading monooxygenase HmoA